MSANRERRWWGWLLLASGPVIGVAVVGLAAPRQTPTERAALGDWLSWSTAPWRALHPAGSPRWLLVVAVAALVLAWGAAGLVVARWQVPARGALGLAWLWAAPFCLGVPLMSRDVYAYAAQGALLQEGLDPYRHTVRELGPTALVRTVDPVWQGSTVPYGPLAVRLEQLCRALSGGDLVLNIVLLRVLVVLCIAGSLAVLWSCLPPSHRPQGLWIAFSPLVMLQLIAACHLEALIVLTLVASVALAMKRHLAAAAAVAVAGCEVKATAVLVLLVVLLHAWASGGWRPAGRVVLASAAAGAAGVLLLPRDPFGWVDSLSSTASSWSPFAPSSTLFLVTAKGLPGLGRADLPALLQVCRVIIPVVAVGVLVLLYRSRSRLLLQQQAALVLLVVLSAGPVLWPWYLAPSCALLVLGGGRSRQLSAVIAGVAALSALPLGTVMAQEVMVVAEALGVVLLAAQLRPGWLFGRSQERGRMIAPWTVA